MKWIKYSAVSLGLLSLLFLSFRSCSLTDKYSQLKGRYEAYRAIAKADNEVKNTLIGKQQTTIEQLQKTIETQKTDVEKTKVKIRQLDTTALEKAYAKLTDADQKVVNLETQVSIWKQKFTLAQDAIAKQEDIIFNLEQKYQALVVITETFRSQYENEQRLHAMARELLGHAELKLRQRKAESTLKNIAIILLGGYVVYTAMTK